jgi:hypothetical protein
MAVVGIGVTLALVVFWIYNEASGQRQRAMLAGMPPGWMTMIRQRATVPASVSALEPARTVDDNGAFAVYDTAMGVWTLFQMDSAFVRITGSRPQPQDAFTIRELLSDAALDRWVRWAEHREWDALALILERSEAGASEDLLRMRVPDYRGIRAATTALALRGWVRAERGERAGAERDLRAAVGLGAMLARHEPTMAGFLAGRWAVHAGALGLQHLALLTRNSALADVAADAAAWAAPSTASDYDVLAANPDSGLSLAADTAIALGWRAEALHSVIRGAMVKPSARLFGFPRRVQRRLDEIAANSRGDFGRLARLAAGSARAIDDMGPRARMTRFAN